MKVALWKSVVSDELRRALSERGVEIVVLLGGRDDEIPAYSTYDLFFGTGDVSFGSALRPPQYFSDTFIEEYSRCVGRIGFNPLTQENCFSGGGIVNPDNVMDWAQFHADIARNLFEAYKPDQLWVANNPHMGFDNALVDVASGLGLKVLEFSPVPIPEKFGFRIKAERRGEGQKEKLRFEKRDLNDFSPNTFYMRTVKRDRKEKALERLLRLARVTVRQKSLRSFLAAAYDFTLRHRMAWMPSILELADRNQRVAALPRLQRRLSASGLRKDRPQIADWEQSESPFVYFPLHYEPEAAVSVVKDGFHNQVNAIQELRASLPGNWSILLKENPKQGYLHRDRAFYTRISAMNHVAFVEDHCESQALIDAAKFVATITGTAGYEAIRSGKTCVYFGDPWYANLPGTIRFDPKLDFKALSDNQTSRADLNEALSEKSCQFADGLLNHWMAEIVPGDRSLKAVAETTADSLLRIADSSRAVE